MYPFMGFGARIIWLIAIAVIAYLVYRLIKDERILAPAARKNAEDILDDRYAKGELTREQYAQMKEDIKKAT
jgi:putative membrane protein